MRVRSFFKKHLKKRKVKETKSSKGSHKFEIICFQERERTYPKIAITSGTLDLKTRESRPKFWITKQAFGGRETAKIG
ncbi:hypothetical protein DLM78_14155 [Leptospira stimsonii]|uniref:Uncharacterized protein n=1 Tax=Leptospira stimsonii TaxID=2202203 RepID=A0A8B3CRP7_9LEPT|nr:hypothetical protein DLM78_14155 [Leptospira stimsonii]